MATKNNTKSTTEEIASYLLSLDDESIQQVLQNLQLENVCAVKKIGRKLKESAEAEIEGKFRSAYVTIDENYSDFGINKENVKRFASRFRNIRIQGWNFRERKIVTFIESNFLNLKVIEFKFGSVISHHLRKVFKNIDTIIFNRMFSDGDFCYHNDCLRYCENLRCLGYTSFTTTEDEEDKFNAILSQTYSGLEKVHFNFALKPNFNNWTRFIQRNTNIQNLFIRFLNRDAKMIMPFIKPIVDNAINLRQLFLVLEFDDRFDNVFNFETVHKQLTVLETRENWEYLGIYFASFFDKIINFERVESLESLKLLVVSHPDPCDILPKISRHSKRVKILHLHSAINSCPLGNHRSLATNWNDNFRNLEELHFWQVKNAYFLLSLVIRRSPNLKRVIAHDCKIVFEKKVDMSLKKFNDDRGKVTGETLIIYTNQNNVATNYQFKLVKLKHVKFQMIEFNEHNPFQSWIEDKIDEKIFYGDEKLRHLAMFEDSRIFSK